MEEHRQGRGTSYKCFKLRTGEQSVTGVCFQGDLQSTASVQDIARQVCEQLIQSEYRQTCHLKATPAAAVGFMFAQRLAPSSQRSHVAVQLAPEPGSQSSSHHPDRSRTSRRTRSIRAPGASRGTGAPRTTGLPGNKRHQRDPGRERYSRMHRSH